jgi:hypothetical protein
LCIIITSSIIAITSSTITTLCVITTSTSPRRVDIPAFRRNFFGPFRSHRAAGAAFQQAVLPVPGKLSATRTGDLYMRETKFSNSEKRTQKRLAIVT